MMAVSSVHRIRHRAMQEDEGQAAILVLTVAAALVSLVAIFAQLGTGRGGRRPGGRGGWCSWA